ncbi:thioredoxin-dependent thiol peroxidase [Georgenia satyanarayanai]|uniref:thioredoxin-dependent thiol peroxidase n=1 Tax=Georgenia satyanarayanai TaxID=860221 RepID=UPI00203DD961|nr:thioredoxin-dependent thiol peroxidase [Georgenia satyanarayanai]MCM3660599.1 thioredoxin-dependent thiol peroxidase [Georgenia satyanarayanai]
MPRLTAGDSAPDFTLPAADGSPVTLSEVLAGAERGAVVYFYPKAGTPGCTTEACDFRDNLGSLAAAGYAVVGISADPPEDIQAFVEAERLTFPLLSDADHAVSDAYGTWGPKTVGERTFDGVHRCTFVIGTDATVRSAQYDVEAHGHVAALRDQLSA